MLRPRIIPCLLVHKGGLVKTQQFKAPKYVGDPINARRWFAAVADYDRRYADVEDRLRGLGR